MSDEWNTVNIRPGKGGVLREIEVLRRRYAEHRSTLERLAADAPTEHLARRYHQLIGELDASLARVSELEMGPGGALAAPEPGETDPRWDDAPYQAPAPVREEKRNAPALRMILVAIAAVFILGVVGVLAWSRLTTPEEAEPAVETTPIIEEEGDGGAAVSSSIPLPDEPALSAAPDQQNYGRVNRGARAVRQFEIANNSDATLPISVMRSDCRCLWFEYADTIPPRGTTTLTVTVDGAKAPPGALRETVRVVSRSDPSIVANVEIVADIGG